MSFDDDDTKQDIDQAIIKALLTGIVINCLQVT